MELPVGWTILLLLGVSIYTIVAIYMFIGAVTEIRVREFTCYILFGVASLTWPLTLILALLGFLVEQFLLTPGYTCCGLSFGTTAATPEEEQIDLEAGPSNPSAMDEDIDEETDQDMDEDTDQDWTDEETDGNNSNAPLLSVPPNVGTEAVKPSARVEVGNGSTSVPDGPPPPYA
ncbi:hypothetical protein QBC39DRAFT_333067 [Podospora conica]|nr:hypothetical protein QBC39DRAFT_333067 [Schizothecium conicum]